MRRTVTIKGAHLTDLQQMSDEQLATADELIKETMVRFRAEGDRAKLLRLHEQQRAVDQEAKDRMARRHAERERQR